ncbi:MAG TPA: hypothetical protein VN875_16955 [Candidatus Binatus sp.]|nr:hypothetical protein [Candidatus Binatus sp.]
MTDAAVLIFELAVPVTGGLKRERQYECGHHDGHDPVRRSPMPEQPNTPTPHRCYLDAASSTIVTIIFAAH